MHSKIVISSVVFLHAIVFALVACNSESGFEDIHSKTNTNGAPASPETVSPADAPQTVATPIGESFPTPEPVLITGASEQQPVTVRHPVVRPVPPPPPPPVADPALPASNTYVVKKGDSLSRIAAQYRVSVRALARANNIPISSTLQPRQKLIIPARGTATANLGPATGDTAVAAGTRYHTVKNGELLGTIARKYRVSVTKLMEYNGITNDRTVRAGKKLKIPPTSAAAGTSRGPVRGTAAEPVAPPPLPPLDPIPVAPPTPPAEPDAGTVSVGAGDAALPPLDPVSAPSAGAESTPIQ